jgi:3-methyladenine DNA glycosylase AlkD
MNSSPQTELLALKNPEKAAILQRFFKTGKGEYAEGDQFIGASVPQLRTIAKKHFPTLTLKEIGTLLKSPFHEFRLTALFILVLKFEKAKTESEKKVIFDFYLNHLKYINNWDLVDSSAHKIVGVYLFDKDRDIIYSLVKSQNLWEQRIAIISTFHFIRQKDFNDTLRIAEMVLTHPHDLIHKASGWMLREIGNRNFNVLFDFLVQHYQKMPRTMLRYAIEKLDPETRLAFLKGNI